MPRKRVKFWMRLGCLAAPIEEQLNEQGLTLGESAQHMQSNADSISNLYIQDLLTEAETERARKRLCTLMGKKIRQLEDVQ